MLRMVTELIILNIGIWTIYQLWDMPKEFITAWKEIKTAEELELLQANKKINLT